MTKKELRKAALEQRNLLSDTQVDKYSKQLLDKFTSLNLSAVNVLHLFLPIQEKKEPNTFLFIDWLTLSYPRIKIIVPKACFNTATLSNHLYGGEQDLQKNVYNILEPQQARVYEGKIDLVLVPLLVFDERGYRVGYGKGFYDRFLANSQATKVGLSFFNPVKQIDDVHENDIMLDRCITPDKIYEFPNAN